MNSNSSIFHVKKHTRRIQNYQETYRPVWHFFDLKAYLIMAVMMGGGIWLRYSGLAPDIFIAVFYTGLGCALALAGVLFDSNLWEREYDRQKKTE